MKKGVKKMVKVVSIEVSEGYLSDLYLALDLAIAVMEVEGQGEKEQMVLKKLQMECHWQIEKLQKDL